MTSKDYTIDLDSRYSAVKYELKDSELEVILGHLEDTLTWMETKDLHLPTSEDVVALRFGVPSKKATDTSVAEEVLNADGVTFPVVSVDLDFLSFTVRDTDRPLRKQATRYTYKSKYVHKVIGPYFTAGVDNRTGYEYLDNYTIGLTEDSSMSVLYDVVEDWIDPDDESLGLEVVSKVTQIPSKASNGSTDLDYVQEVPEPMFKALTYLVQKQVLIESSRPTTEEGLEFIEKGGATMYLTSYSFYSTLRSASFRIGRRLEDPDYTNIDSILTYTGAVHNILETTELETAMKSIEMGGDFDKLSVVIRIPTSRQNQDILENLLGSVDFNDVFSEVVVESSNSELSAMTNEDLALTMEELVLKYPSIKHSGNYEDLFDPYTDTKNINGSRHILGDVREGYWGCTYTLPGPVDSNLVFHRYWLVNANWLSSLPPEKLAILFYMGLDLDSLVDIDCPFDRPVQVIAVLVALALSIGSAGALSGVSYAIVVAAAVVAAVIQIALIGGQWTSATGVENASIIAGVLGLVGSGIAILNAPLTVANVGSVVLQTVSLGLEVAKIIDARELREEWDEVNKETERLEGNEGAEMFESEFRFIYESSYEAHIKEGAEKDPYDAIREEFSKFTVYDTVGFT